MSHNIISTGGVSPDSQGVIDMSLTDVSGLSGVTPSNNDVFKLDASGNWSAGGLPATAYDVPVHFSAYSNYSVSSYNYGAGDNFIIYRFLLTLSGVGFSYATGSYVPVQNYSWYKGFTFGGTAFQGKTVLLKAVAAPDCQASFVAQWGFGTGSLASFTPIGPRANANNTWSDVAWGRFVGDGSSKTVALKMISRTGSSSQVQLARGNRAAHYSIIIKVF
tara:strand:+ start:116 stop:772 length:657 start_codon:yes stop_codon:yes gene_type:complete